MTGHPGHLGAAETRGYRSRQQQVRRRGQSRSRDRRRQHLSPVRRNGWLGCLVLLLATLVLGIGPGAGPATAQNTTIEDTDIGTGTNQVSYAGTWSECRNCASSPNSSFRYSFTAGSIATIRFSGTGINVYGLKGRYEGLANFAIDGGSATRVDTYGASDSIVSLFNSTQLAAGSHTLTITVIGQRNPAALGNNVVFDRAVVTDGPPPPATVTVEDTDIGTGLNQITYAGAWTRCAGCAPSTPNNSFQISSVYGAIATVSFSGTQIDVYGIKGPQGGQAAISIDDATPVVVDTFAASQVVTLLFTSGTLTTGTHTLRLTNLQKRNEASLGDEIRFDRVVITPTGTPTPPTPTPTAVTIEDGAIGTGPNQVSYTGTWSECRGCAPSTPDGVFRYSSTSDAAATIRFSGTQINVYGIKAPVGGFGRITIDGGQPTTVDTYAPDIGLTLLFSSQKLAAGTHTLTLTNIHQSNSSATWFMIGFDRAEVTAAAPPAPPIFTGPRSGKPWFTGTYPEPVMTPANIDAFCNWRGAPCDFALLYVTRDTWPNVVEPNHLLTQFANWPGRLIISVPPWPEKVGASNATCATGTYDEYWKAFGRTLNKFGRQDSFIRLAWEANGNWYPWSGTNPTDFVNCWRHAADAINATAEPDPTLCWCVNAHYSQNPPSHNAMELYPGDAWVDGVGLDAYDHWPPSRTKAEFDAQINATGGLNYWWNFARAHNKIFGVGEWGVVSGSGANGGGDNANYVQWMYDWFVDHAGKGLAYEYYFNTCERNNVGSNLWRPRSSSCFWLNPNAGQRYRDLYRGT